MRRYTTFAWLDKCWQPSFWGFFVIWAIVETLPTLLRLLYTADGVSYAIVWRTIWVGLMGYALWRVSQWARGIIFWRYDAQAAVFLRCRWGIWRWEILQSYPKNGFTGIQSEKVYWDDGTVTGSLWLLGQQAVLVEAVTEKNDLSRIDQVREQISQVSHLPILVAEERHETRPTEQPAKPHHYQECLPVKSSCLMLATHLVWAAIWWVGMGYFVWWFRGETVIVAFSVLGFAYAFAGSLKVWQMWRDNQIISKMVCSESIPPRRMVARKSGKFALFSLKKYLICTLLSLIIWVWAAVAMELFDNWLWFVLGNWTILLFILGILGLFWHGVSRRRRVVYSVNQDTFLIQKLKLPYTWQPEYEYAVNDFIGVSGGVDGLWLIGAEGKIDVWLGKASGVSQIAPQRAETVAWQISQATGLPIVIKKTNSPV